MDQPIEVTPQEYADWQKRLKQQRRQYDWLHERRNWWVAFEDSDVLATIYTYGIDFDSVYELGNERWLLKINEKRWLLKPDSPRPFHPTGLIVATISAACTAYHLGREIYEFAHPEEVEFRGF